ncbi:bifunctional 2-polyprenyl-6-hydroxyphenol methylase/3-demethylubiquinol 3-O-methyltransferase UbiG [Mycobacterium sp. 141]|uniref:class I SAM-dependent methyltransferase n=1 Tax=Mycobacterium sp. 141 TaxID=1120797 RepID=UPI000379F530|nr:class I SAM-dependent methyltransferase [Mycobacterium sp. 141]
MQDQTSGKSQSSTPAYDPEGDAREFWDSIYRRAGQAATGRVNAPLVEFASQLVPGKALDLGCGTGGDSIWLAQHGWRVVAVDVAPSALRLAADFARQLHVDESIEFQQHDLSDSFPVGSFDLVSAQYLHSPVRFHRPEILKRAVNAVRPGGTLLIVDHGSAAPWSWKISEHQFLSPQEVLASLQLDDDLWDQLRVSCVDKEVVGPDGQTATVTDNVIAVRRHAD